MPGVQVACRTVVDNGAEPENEAPHGVGFPGNYPRKEPNRECHLLQPSPAPGGAPWRAAVAVTLALTAGALGLVSGPSAATPPTQDGAVAADYAGHWLAARVTADGSVHDANDHPSPGATLATALALATAGVEQTTFDRTLTWLSGHVESVIVNVNTDDDPGNLGELMIVAHAAGQDPTSFGGVDLVTRLGATLGLFEPGLYGHSDPTYDGAFRQSFALLGLAAAGVTPPPAAVTWLTSQQCVGADLTIQGGWQAYRAPQAACDPPDAQLFSGVDTNSTAAAAEALDALDVIPSADALAWLDRAQNTTGGWGFVPGAADDPNSTALVVQAIVAAGESPSAGRWISGTHTALSALLSFQLGCDAPVADRGAFTYPGGGPTPNALATQQAVWGAAQHAFPLGPITFGATPDPCAPPVPTTTTTQATSPVVPVAEAVAATPAFTG